MNINEFYEEHSVRDYDENIIGVVTVARRSRGFGDLEWLIHEVDDGTQTLTLLEANGSRTFPVGTRVQAVAYASTNGFKVRGMREINSGAS